MWIWRRMERVKWADRIRTEAMLERNPGKNNSFKLSFGHKWQIVTKGGTRRLALQPEAYCAYQSYPVNDWVQTQYVVPELNLDYDMDDDYDDDDDM
ncbi:hypothetical protein ANN_02855 [Periplaneta americana]|uniref:Uncharacterized protein n=1 Tax=Periplaneta americana TaxID=6978 RepID=A0ABQ8TXL7_PERAM|nr:hypothetical protein ANN_02855 [Periplaneta americana]